MDEACPRQPALAAPVRPDGELEARDRMVDARAIAYMIHVVGHAARQYVIR